MKKWVSHLIDGVLVVFILGLVGCQITLNLTSKDNYGLGSLFGRSFVRVETDSMVGENSSSLNVGTGIVVEKRDPSAIKVGDVITFYSVAASQEFGGYQRVTHRVFQIITDQQYGLIFYTYGDNAHAETCPVKNTEKGCDESVRDSYKDTVYANPDLFTDATKNQYLGVVVSHSDAFGWCLGVVQSSYFVPIAVLIPLLAIAVLSAVDLIREVKKANKEEQDELEKRMRAAGIDPSNEKDALLFTEKETYKLDLEKELKAQKEAEKKKILKEMGKMKNPSEGEH